MLKFAPTEIEAAILYPGACPDIGFPDILDHLNKTFEGALEPFRYSTFATDASTLFVGSDLFILISKNPEPLGPQGFAGSLASPYTRMTFEDAERAVAQHLSNIFITVSCEPPLGDVGRELKTKLGLAVKEQRPEVFDMKLAICKMLAQFICARSRPSAVNWCQSSQLLPPDRFAMIASAEPLPTPLFIHPSFFSSNKMIAGRRVIGARGSCSEHFINRQVVVNEAPMPFSWVFERICNFVDMVRERDGALIPDGDTFGSSEREIIRVRHEEPSEAEPFGVVYLTLEASDEVDLAAAPKSGGLAARLGRLFR